jgi:hypothetical protein
VPLKPSILDAVGREFLEQSPVGRGSGRAED